MRQLIWKEWHEQSWKLAFACIVLTAFVAIGLRTRIILDQEMILWVCMPAMCLLPLLAATGLIPAERSDGTFESLAALPISLRKVLAVKALTGLMLCVVPLLAAMVASLAIAGGRELASVSIISLYARSIFTAAALFMWMLALTIRLPSEARAAMVSIGMLMCWSMASAGIWQLRMPLIMDTISPFSLVINQMNLDYRDIPTPSLALNVLVEALISAALWWCASCAIAKDVNSAA